MNNIIGTLIMALLAAGAFAIAWNMVKEELAFLTKSHIVEGEVVDHVFLRSSDSGPASERSGGGHYPIVRYVTENGQEYQVQGRVGAGNRQTLSGGIESGSNYDSVGSKLRVAYRRDNPENARVLGFRQQYLFPLIIVCIGLVLLMFAFLVFFEGNTQAP